MQTQVPQMLPKAGRQRRKKEKEIEVLTAHANEGLVAKVAAMPEKRRQKEIRRLNELSSFDFTRENNIAYRQMLEKQIGQPWDVPAPKPPAVEPTESPVSPRSSPDPTPESPGPPVSTLGPDIHGVRPTSPPNPASSRPSTPPVSSSPAPTSPAPKSPAARPATIEPSTARSTRSSTTTTAPVDRSGWPAWMEKHYTRFSEEEIGDTHLEAWRGLLRAWVLLERSLEFKQTVSSLKSI